eukprot:6174976-Pleurochrysis_carterae.AAC.3
MDPAERGGAVYNVDTLTMFVKFVRRGGSRHADLPDATLRAGTVAGYVSAICMLRSRELHREMAPELQGGGSTLTTALKRMRQEDPPVGARTLSRGFRAQHFRVIVDAGG